MDGLSNRRKKAAEQLEEKFESNLQDFPDVDEVDDNGIRQFDASSDRHRNQ
ncbi:MAG: hypothetical protein WC953_11320 [Pseudomonas sp.]